MKAIITNESKDNNPSPLEAIDKIEIRIGSMSLQLGKEFKIIEQALTNYANMVEMLEGLVEKYEKKLTAFNDIKVSNQDEFYHNLAVNSVVFIIADITKVLEGKINET
jgi:hypothetical protein